MSFHVTFTEAPRFSASFSATEAMKAEFSNIIEVPVADYYEGDYTITPTAAAQTIPVIGKTMRQNLKVDPIPSNYGLITWNGSTLTVS